MDSEFVFFIGLIIAVFLSVKFSQFVKAVERIADGIERKNVHGKRNADNDLGG